MVRAATSRVDARRPATNDRRMTFPIAAAARLPPPESPAARPWRIDGPGWLGSTLLCALLAVSAGVAANTAATVPAPASAGAAHAGPTWPVIGRQGIVRIVIVPVEQAHDREAYARQLQQLCVPDQACFINFYTNASGVTPAVPLPEAIMSEATALFRRSPKQGAELFQWSCRMGKGPAEGACF